MNNINWNLLGLQRNPFGIIPDIESNKIIWAGFGKTKTKFERILSNSVSSDETKAVLTLSRWGGGKTHAAV